MPKDYYQEFQDLDLIHYDNELSDDRFRQSKLPGRFRPSKLPGRFRPSKLPGRFRPSKLPGRFRPSKLPGRFRPSKLPGRFRQSELPDPDGEGGASAGSGDMLAAEIEELIRWDKLSIRWDRLISEATTGFNRVVRKNAFGTVHDVRNAPQSLFRAVPRGEGNELALAYLFTLSNDNGEGLKNRFLGGVDRLSQYIQARSRVEWISPREAVRPLDFYNLVSGLHEHGYLHAEHGYLHAGGEWGVLDIPVIMTLDQITSALERSSGDAYYQLNTGNHELVVAKKTIAGQPRYFFYDPNLAEVSLQGATQADSALALKKVIKSHLDQKSKDGNWDGTLADFYGVRKDDSGKITFDVYHLNQARLNGKQAFVDFENLLSSDAYRTERDRLVDVGNVTVEGVTLSAVELYDLGATIDGERITSALDLSSAEIQAKLKFLPKYLVKRLVGVNSASASDTQMQRNVQLLRKLIDREGGDTRKLLFGPGNSQDKDLALKALDSVKKFIASDLSINPRLWSKLQGIQPTSRTGLRLFKASQRIGRLASPGFLRRNKNSEITAEDQKQQANAFGRDGEFDLVRHAPVDVGNGTVEDATIDGERITGDGERITGDGERITSALDLSAKMPENNLQDSRDLTRDANKLSDDRFRQSDLPGRDGEGGVSAGRAEIFEEAVEKLIRWDGSGILWDTLISEATTGFNRVVRKNAFGTVHHVRDAPQSLFRAFPRGEGNELALAYLFTLSNDNGEGLKDRFLNGVDTLSRLIQARSREGWIEPREAARPLDFRDLVSGLHEHGYLHAGGERSVLDITGTMTLGQITSALERSSGDAYYQLNTGNHELVVAKKTIAGQPRYFFYDPNLAEVSLQGATQADSALALKKVIKSHLDQKSKDGNWDGTLADFYGVRKDDSGKITFDVYHLNQARLNGKQAFVDFENLLSSDAYRTERDRLVDVGNVTVEGVTLSAVELYDLGATIDGERITSALDLSSAEIQAKLKFLPKYLGKRLVGVNSASASDTQMQRNVQLLRKLIDREGGDTRKLLFGAGNSRDKYLALKALNSVKKFVSASDLSINPRLWSHLQGIQLTSRTGLRLFKASQRIGRLASPGFLRRNKSSEITAEDQKQQANAFGRDGEFDLVRHAPVDVGNGTVEGATIDGERITSALDLSAKMPENNLQDSRDLTRDANKLSDDRFRQSELPGRDGEGGASAGSGDMLAAEIEELIRWDKLRVRWDGLVSEATTGFNRVVRKNAFGTVHHVHDAPQSLFRAVPRGEGNELALAYLFTLSNDNGEGLKDRFLNGVDTLSRLIQAQSREGWIELREAARTLDFRDLVSGLHEHGYLHAEHGYLHAGGEWGVLDIPVIMTLDQITSALERSSGDAYYQLNTGNHELVVAKKTIAGQPRYFFYDPNLAEVSLQGATQAVSALALKKVIKSHLDQKSKDGNWDGTLADFYGVRKDDSAEITFDVYHLNQARLNGKQAFVDFENLLSSDAYRTERDRLVDVGNVTVEGVTLSAVELYDLGATIDGERITSALDLSSAEIQAKLKFLPKYLVKRLVGVNTASASDTQMQRNVQLLRKLIDREGGDTRKLLFGPGNSRDKYLALKALNSVKKFVSASDLSINPRLWSHLQGIQLTSRTGLRLFKASQRIGRLASPGFLRRNKSSEITAEDQKQQANAFGRDGEFDLVRHAPVDVGNGTVEDATIDGERITGDGERITGDGERITSALDLSAKMPENNLQDSRDLTRDANKLSDDRFRQSDLPGRDGEGGVSAGRAEIFEEAVEKLIRWDGSGILWDTLISEATTGFNRVVRKNAFGTVHHVRDAPQSLFRAFPRGEGNELALAYLFTLSNDNGEGLKDRFLNGVDTLSRLIQARSREGWIEPREAARPLDFRDLVSGLHEHGYLHAGGERSVLDITGTMTLGQITSALERSSGDAYYQVNTGNHELVVAKKTIAGQPRYFFYDPNLAEVSLQGATQADSALALKKVIKSHLDQKSKDRNWYGTLADFYGVRKDDSGKITFDVYHLNQARLNGKQAFVDFENLLSSDAYRTERDRLVDVGNVTVEGVTLSAVELYDLGATIDGERITSALDLSSAEIQAKLKFLPKYLGKRLVGVNSASASDTQMQRNVQLLRKLIDREGGDTRKLLFGAGNSQDKDLALKALNSVKKFIASDLSINSRLWSHLQGIQPTSRTGLRLFKASQRIGRLASPGFLRRNKSSEITAEDQKQQANAFGRDGEFDLVRHAPVDVGNGTVEGATIDGERITGDGERITSALDLSAKMPENNFQDSRDLTRYASKLGENPSLQLLINKFNQDTIDSGVGSLLAEIDEIDDTLADLDDITWVERRRTVTAELMLELHEVFRIKDDGSIASREEFQNVVRQLRAVDAPDQVISDLQTAYNQFKENFESLITSDAWLLLADQGRTDDRFRQSELPDPDGEGGASAGSGDMLDEAVEELIRWDKLSIRWDRLISEATTGFNFSIRWDRLISEATTGFNRVVRKNAFGTVHDVHDAPQSLFRAVPRGEGNELALAYLFTLAVDNDNGEGLKDRFLNGVDTLSRLIQAGSREGWIKLREAARPLDFRNLVSGLHEHGYLHAGGERSVLDITGTMTLGQITSALEGSSGDAYYQLNTGNHALVVAKKTIAGQPRYFFYDPNFAEVSLQGATQADSALALKNVIKSHLDQKSEYGYWYGTLADFYGVRKDDSAEITFDVYHLNQARLNGKQAFVDFENLLSSDAYRTERDRLVDVGNVTVEGVTLSAVELYDLGATIDGERITSALDLSSAEIQAKLKFLPKYLVKRLVGVNSASASDTQMQRNVQLLRNLIDREGGDTRKLLFGPGNSQDKYLALKALDSVKKFIAFDLSINPRLWSKLQGIQLTSRTGLRLFKASQRIGRLASPGFLRRNKSSEITAEDQKQQANAFGRDGEFDLVRHAPVDVGNGTVEGATRDGERITGNGERITSALDLSSAGIQAKMPENNFQDFRDLTRYANKYATKLKLSDDRFRQSKLPGRFRPSKLPGRFRPSKLPGRFRPSKLPGRFRQSKLPDWFRQSKLPGRDGEGGASAGSGDMLAAEIEELIRWDKLSIRWDGLVSEATTGFNRVVRKNAFGTVHHVHDAPQSLFRAVPRGEGNELALAYLFTLSNDNGEGLKDRFLNGVDTLSRLIQEQSREGGIELREAARTLDFRNLVSGLHEHGYLHAEHGYLHAGGEWGVLDIPVIMTLDQITSALERSSGDAYYQLNTGNHELVVAKKTIAGQPRYFFYDPNLAEVSLQGATQADSALALKKVIKSHLDQKSKYGNWDGTLADFYGVRKDDSGKITFDVYHLNQARLNGKQAFVDFENLLSSDAYRTERDRLVDVGNVKVEGVTLSAVELYDLGATIDGKRITGDGKRITGDGKRITGDGKRITGDGEQITGDGERITGDGKRITGDGERITGDGKRITGDGERITGDGERITGDGERITGDGERITGDGERITGDDDRITGDGERITGDGERITGDDDRITGDGERITGDGERITSAMDLSSTEIQARLKFSPKYLVKRLVGVNTASDTQMQRNVQLLRKPIDREGGDTGDGERITGDGERITGDGERITGDGERITGDGERITSAMDLSSAEIQARLKFSPKYLVKRLVGVNTASASDTQMQRNVQLLRKLIDREGGNTRKLLLGPGNSRDKYLALNALNSVKKFVSASDLSINPRLWSHLQTIQLTSRTGLRLFKISQRIGLAGTGFGYVQSVSGIVNYLRRRKSSEMTAENQKQLDIQLGVNIGGLVYDLGSNFLERGINRVAPSLIRTGAKLVRTGAKLASSGTQSTSVVGLTVVESTVVGRTVVESTVVGRTGAGIGKGLAGLTKAGRAASVVGRTVSGIGKALAKAGGAVLAVLGSGFDIYGAYEAFSKLDSATGKHRIDLIVNGTLSVAGAVVGIVTGTAAAVLAASSAGGPVVIAGMIIAALLALGGSIYNAVRVIDDIDDYIELTPYERLRNGWLAFWGMDVDPDIENRANKAKTLEAANIQIKKLLKEANEKILETDPSKPGIHEVIYSPGGDVILEEHYYRRVEVKVRYIREGGGGRTGSTRSYEYKWEVLKDRVKPEDVDSVIRKSKTRFKIRVVQSELKYWTLAGLEDQDDMVNVRTGVSNARSVETPVNDEVSDEAVAFFNLGGGNDYAIGYDDRKNHFVVYNGYKYFIGGSRDDVFILIKDDMETTANLYGKDGDDTLVLKCDFSSAGGVQLQTNLETGKVTLGNEILANIVDFEKVTGSDLDVEETITGNDQDNVLDSNGGRNNWLFGKGGDDILIVHDGTTAIGGTGDDVFILIKDDMETMETTANLYGKDGDDTLVLKCDFSSAGGVQLQTNLETGKVTLGNEILANIVDFEKVTGSDLDVEETITGNDQDNVLDSNGGRNNWLFGKGGDDILIVHDGTTAIGGTGADTYLIKSDAGEPESDAGEPESDAGEPESDAGEPESDAGEPESDAGEVVIVNTVGDGSTRMTDVTYEQDYLLYNLPRHLIELRTEGDDVILSPKAGVKGVPSVRVKDFLLGEAHRHIGLIDEGGVFYEIGVDENGQAYLSDVGVLMLQEDGERSETPLGKAVVRGTKFADRIVANSVDAETSDVLIGGGGDDTLIGAFGNDTLKGGSGNDIIISKGGEDHIIGGDGSDDIIFDVIASGIKVVDSSNADGMADTVWLPFSVFDANFAREGDHLVVQGHSPFARDGVLLTVVLKDYYKSASYQQINLNSFVAKDGHISANNMEKYSVEVVQGHSPFARDGELLTVVLKDYYKSASYQQINLNSFVEEGLRPSGGDQADTIDQTQRAGTATRYNLPNQKTAANVERLIQDMATQYTESSAATQPQQDIDIAKYWQVSPNTQST